MQTQLTAYGEILSLSGMLYDPTVQYLNVTFVSVSEYREACVIPDCVSIQDIHKLGLGIYWEHLIIRGEEKVRPFISYLVITATPMETVTNEPFSL